ncbi:hypothetical protein DBA29_21775 [Xenophilus aerolatus]|nr:hypothetical protein [Xenophilus aerolatus]
MAREQAWEAGVLYMLAKTVFEQPCCPIGNLVSKGIAQRQAASRYLQDLVGAGVLRKQVIGREKLFIHPTLIRLLSQDGGAVAPYAVPAPPGL